MNTASENKETEMLTQSYEELLLCNACIYRHFLALCVSQYVVISQIGRCNHQYVEKYTMGPYSCNEGG
jgi:hypothetical protein